MRSYIALFAVTAVIFCVAEVSEAARTDRVYNCSKHAHDRRHERGIDINEARRAMSRGAAKKVGTRDGKDIYEGTYYDSREYCNVRFRLVISQRDSSVVTAIRL